MFGIFRPLLSIGAGAYAGSGLDGFCLVLSTLPAPLCISVCSMLKNFPQGPEEADCPFTFSFVFSLLNLSTLRMS